MSYKIVVDSCCDLPPFLKEMPNVQSVPLTLIVDGKEYVDDESFDRASFIRAVAGSSDGGRSSCPSPSAYFEAFSGEYDDIYVVTLSSQLSGSYNSAIVASNMHHDEAGKKNIHVFDSKSASCGQTLIAYKISRLAEKGIGFDGIVKRVEKYIEELDTYFVLETLETLRKNGRLNSLSAFVATALNIKPVMGSTDAGTIQKIEQVRGMNKSLRRLAAIVCERTRHAEGKVLAIAHCNCRERAEFVKREIEKISHFKEIVIVETGGVSTLYANNGGIIVAV